MYLNLNLDTKFIIEEIMTIQQTITRLALNTLEEETSFAILHSTGVLPI